MTSVIRFEIGTAMLTRVAYFEVSVPAEAVALSPPDIAAVGWAMPVWCENETSVRVGQVFWIIESQGSMIVIDPCCASDAFLRTDAAALDHQSAAFTTLRDAGFDPDAVDVVIMSHLDGIGMNALVSEDGGWRRAFSNAPILVSDMEYERINTRQGISGVEAFHSLEAAGHVQTVALPHAVTDEVAMVTSGGHTAGHATIVVESQGERALFLGHLAINPVHAAADHEIALHDDPPVGAVALERWISDAATDGALLIGPLWPAPGAARVTGLNPVVLEPA